MKRFAFLGKLGPIELMILAGICLLFFNDRLPRVLRRFRDPRGGNGPFSIP